MRRALAMMAALFMLMMSVSGMAEDVRISPTTGLPTDSAYQPMAVIVDNSADARPHINMSMADVIYEIEIADGGYTCYAAIYNDEIPETAEAVRSARIMHVDVALDWSAPLVHFGAQTLSGSSVEDYVKTVEITRYDGLKSSKHFYRDQSRIAPYNVVGKLREMQAGQAPAAETPRTPLAFSGEEYTVKGEDVTVFRIPYNTEIGFYPSYEYDEEEEKYFRYYNRQKMIDGGTGEQFSCSNVIVMYADYSWFDGAADRPIVALTGTNRCEFFIGGKHFTGTWSRRSVDESTVYRDGDGMEVVLKPGKTFIQIVKPGIEIEIAK